MNQRLFVELSIRLIGVGTLAFGLLEVALSISFLLIEYAKEGNQEINLAPFLFLFAKPIIGFSIIRWSNKLTNFLLQKESSAISINSFELIRLGLSILSGWTILIQVFHLLNSLEVFLIFRKFQPEFDLQIVQQTINNAIIIGICLLTIGFSRQIAQRIQTFSS